MHVVARKFRPKLQESNLRPIPMREDESFPRLDEIGDRFHRLGGDRKLIANRGRKIGIQERMPADGDHGNIQTFGHDTAPQALAYGVRQKRHTE